jgi:ribosomal-protein-alanine N-acetyltransferase
MEAAFDPLDAIMGVMARAFDPQFGEAWNRRQVSDAMVLGNCHYGLITADGDEPADKGCEVAGFYLSRAILDEEELLLFAIDPAHRRKGLGHALLRRMLASARERDMSRVFLEMRRGNPAEVLYTAHGFRQIGVRPNYYRTSAGTRIDALSQELILA